MNAEWIAARMAALGNPMRLEIYRQLVRSGPGGLAVGVIRERLDLPGSTLSHHLRSLRDVGLVRQERRGTTLLCRADFGVMNDTFDWMARECCIESGDGCASDGSESHGSESHGSENTTNKSRMVRK
ncbi:MAG: helix-turn-helix transcriptional regulator [Planctomycetes bacterium]|nr:helix-turn-helix transcriptional regulator [Planctomycetota bacterium]MCB9891671.1 helix-turn-helix transcriptional regulator [Planctomycetota bacterium]MCB9919223.1 helix-turn-helix transcriptional regulator [Planctomycetota bacterium]